MTLPQKKDYQVAWISTLAKEYIIARAVLDERYEKPADFTGNDKYYNFGRIGDYKVVMARLPPEKIGTFSTGTLATEIVRTFPSVRFGLLVGIAGGAPTKDCDVRLGDVVVSQPNSGMSHGRVVHYVLDRSTPDKRTGYSKPLPKDLLSAIRRLKTDHEENGVYINEIIQAVIYQNSPRLDSYKRVSKASDILYTSSFIHNDPSVRCTNSCSLSASNTIIRQERVKDSLQPHIHHGIIGSVDEPMRDAKLRDQIAQQDGVLCFETEAGGLANTKLGCLIIRGICDYSDTHKNADWQHYAAATAAAYAKQLLGVLGHHEPIQENPLISPSHQVRKPLPTDVLELLSYEGMNDKLDYSKSETAFNHDWIWSTSFDSWLAKSSRPYWICGKPGSGKSTLMAYLATNRQLLDKIEARGAPVKIVHFLYDCRAGSSLANNIQGMLRMLTYQLANHFPTVRHHLEELQADGRLKIDTTDELTTVTCEALNSTSSELCVFIDGLDEYEGDLFELMHTIRSLKDWTGIKLCVASRPEARVADVFQLFDTILMQNHNQASMRAYATSQIISASATKMDIALKFSGPLRDELVEKAEGIILWFKLAVDDIVHNYTPGLSQEEIRDLINAIPQGLDALYGRILGLIPPKYRPEAALLLYLVQELRGLSQNVHELSADSRLSTADFSTTDMDHLWAAYDFIVEQIGDDIDRQHSPTALQSNIKMLLGGLLEVYEVEPQTAPTRSAANLDIRYIHKTLYPWLRKTGWIEKHLPSQISRRYPSPFRLTFLSALIEQAAQDDIITSKDFELYLEDSLFMLRGWGTIGSEILRGFDQFWSDRRSILLALYREFGIYGLAKQGYSRVVLKNFDEFYADLVSSEYEFPKKWKSRKALLRTACLNILDISYTFEKNGGSTFAIISESMKSRLAAITAFHCFAFAMNTEDSVGRARRQLFATSLRDAELREVWDLALAIVKDLPGYLEHGLSASKSLSTKQKEYLVSYLLTLSFEPRMAGSVERIAEILADNGCSMDARHLCFFMRNSKRPKLAAEHTNSLRYLVPSLTEIRGGHCDCKHESKPVEPLFHWAQYSTIEDSALSNLTQMKVAHAKLLKFVLQFDADVDAKCYSGGNVLNATIDQSIRPLHGCQDLQRKVKFIVLMEHGIDGSRAGTNGTPLENVKMLKQKTQQIRYQVFRNLRCSAPDLKDYEFIETCLEFYEINQFWPCHEPPDTEIHNDSNIAEAESDKTLVAVEPMPLLDIQDHPSSSRDRNVVNSPAQPNFENAPIESPTRQLKVLTPRGEGASRATAHLLLEEEPNTPEDAVFFDAQSSWTTKPSLPPDYRELDSEPVQEIGAASSSVSRNRNEPRNSSTDVKSQAHAPGSDQTLQEPPKTGSKGKSSASTSDPAPLYDYSHLQEADLNRLWDDQISHFTVDIQPIPPKLLKELTAEQLRLWLFVIQTLETLGLEITRDVKDSAGFVLRKLRFSNARPAMLGILRAQHREDLVARLYEIEKLHLLPVLSVQPPASTTAQSAGIDHIASVSESNLPNTASESVTQAFHNSAPDLSTVKISEEADDDPDMEAAIVASIKSRIANDGDPIQLSHRAHLDPAKRVNLKSDPGAVEQKNFRRDQYDTLLVEDFKWVIVNCLGYGQELVPSRRLAYQCLEGAGWDFELAVAKYVRTLDR